MPACGDYAISKLGVEGFSNCLRREMRQFGVKVCIVQPGNFMSTTNILGQPGSNNKYSMRYFWSLMDEGAKEDYGVKTMAWQEKLVAFGKAQSFPTTAPCIDAMVEALCRIYPKTHYFVAHLWDKISIHFAELLPAWIADEFYEIMMKILVGWWEISKKLK